MITPLTVRISAKIITRIHSKRKIVVQHRYYSYQRTFMFQKYGAPLGRGCIAVSIPTLHCACYKLLRYFVCDPGFLDHWSRTCFNPRQLEVLDVDVPSVPLSSSPLRQRYEAASNPGWIYSTSTLQGIFIWPRGPEKCPVIILFIYSNVWGNDCSVIPSH